MWEKGGAEVDQQRHRSFRAYLRIEGIIPRNPLAIVPNATHEARAFFSSLKKGETSSHLERYSKTFFNSQADSSELIPVAVAVMYWSQRCLVNILKNDVGLLGGWLEGTFVRALWTHVWSVRRNSWNIQAPAVDDALGRTLAFFVFLCA